MTLIVPVVEFARALAATLPVALPLALVAGTHAATWGAYKDSPYEGYHPMRQLRTLAVAGVAAVVGVMTGLVDPHALVPAIGVVYTLERLSTEWWKTIVRVDDQSVYTIPMRLGFRGRPVDLNWLRYGVGAVVLIALVGVGAGMHVVQSTTLHAFGGLPPWVVILGVGGLGGWATAVGGAWKDAPVEGFSFWKFLRSPVVATTWALPLFLMTTDWVTLCLAAGGLSVFSIETYKTFWTGGRAPGKFAGRPLRSHSVPRRAMGMLHAGAWVMFAVAGLRETLSSLAPGLRVAEIVPLALAGSTTWMHVPMASHAFVALLSPVLVAAAALLAAVFVLRSNALLDAPSTSRLRGPAVPIPDDLGEAPSGTPPHVSGVREGSATA